MNKWNFDVEYLQSVVDKGKYMLMHDNLSRKRYKVIETDVRVFENFLTGKYILDDTSYSYRKLSFTRNKNMFLEGARVHYNFLGEELMNFIIELCDAHIFYGESVLPDELLSFDDQVELTLENYSCVSNKLYDVAKKLILDREVSQIQIVDDLDESSYCHYSDIVGLPFIIMGSDEYNNAFNHEAQHAIEDMLNLSYSSAFLELGAITLELLFNDKLYEKRHYLCSDDYNSRLEETVFHLIELKEYFVLIKEFKKRNFELEDKEFIDLCCKYLEDDPESIKSWLLEVVNNCDYDLYMCYTFSYLKAIELREIINNTKCDALELLNTYYKKNFNFRIPKESLEIYQRYIKEMKEKTKCLKKEMIYNE